RTTTTRWTMLLLRNARSISSSSFALSSTRTITRSGMGLRQREVEGRARAGKAVGPDPAAVALGDPRHGREADARAGVLGLGVQALEHAEQLVAIRHVEPGAVVAHEVGDRAVGGGLAELDPRRAALRGELPGVAEQVIERDR